MKENKINNVCVCVCVEPCELCFMCLRMMNIFEEPNGTEKKDKIHEEH